MSAERTLYALFVASGMRPQSDASAAPPLFGQRLHWNANVIGVDPDQLPSVAVRECPTTGVPRMRGWPVGLGAVAGDAPTPVGSSAATMTPAATRERVLRSSRSGCGSVRARSRNS